MKNIIKNRFGVWATTLVMLGFALSFGISIVEAAVTTTLSPGESNSDVIELQTFLRADAALYPEGLVTGYYGNLTTLAVQRFQCKYGIVCSGSVEATGYGRVGPLTLAKIQSLESGIVIPPTTGDVWAPILSGLTVATTSTSASIHWNTNEPALSLVMYSTSVPFPFGPLANSTSVADASINTSNDVLITGLLPNTVYYYTLQSADISANLQWGIDNWFRTGN